MAPITVHNPDGLTEAEIARGDRIHRAIVHLDDLGEPNRLLQQTIRIIMARDGLYLSCTEQQVVRTLRSCREPWNEAGPADLEAQRAVQRAAHQRALNTPAQPVRPAPQPQEPKPCPTPIPTSRPLPAWKPSPASRSSSQNAWKQWT